MPEGKDTLSPMSKIPEMEYLPDGISNETLAWLMEVKAMLHAGRIDFRINTQRDHREGVYPGDLLIETHKSPYKAFELITSSREILKIVSELRNAGAMYGGSLRETALRLLDLPRRPVDPPAPTRPSWDETGMALAKIFAARSVDEKIKVGVVILSEKSRTVVSAGLNGRYPGSPDERRQSLEVGGSEFVHGEQAAIVRARWEYGEDHCLFTTVEPCHECALLILAARHIKRVVYQTPYAGDGKRRRGSEILREAGIEVVEWTQ